jgi:hypothetical protein
LNAEFNWWLLIVGLVIGAALTWLVMSESVRRDIDVLETEQRNEAGWISSLMAGAGRPVSPERVEEILRLHREFLAAPPPDDPSEPVTVAQADAVGPGAAPDRRALDDVDRGDAVARRSEGRADGEG